MQAAPQRRWTRYIVAGVVIGVPGALYGYDKYQCRRIRAQYMSVAKRYGQVPLPIDQSAAKVACVVEAQDRERLHAIQREFMELAQPLLTAAGVEYEWVDASRKQHAREYVQLTSPSDSKEEEIMISQFPQGKITEERVYSWLVRQCAEMHSVSGSWSVVTPTSFLSHIWSWVWPFSKKESNPVEKVISEPVLSPEEKVISNLQPFISARQFRQGILVFDSVTFSHVVAGIRRAFSGHPEDMKLLFQAMPIRLGQFPSSPSSFIERWFYTRSHVRSVYDFTLAVITEHLIQWNSDLESKYPDLGPSVTSESPL